MHARQAATLGALTLVQEDVPTVTAAILAADGRFSWNAASYGCLLGIWTAVIFTIAEVAGPDLLKRLRDWGGGVSTGWIGAAPTLPFIGCLRSCAGAESRRRVMATFARWSRWELWPAWLFYITVFINYLASQFDIGASRFQLPPIPAFFQVASLAGPKLPPCATFNKCVCRVPQRSSPRNRCWRGSPKSELLKRPGQCHTSRHELIRSQLSLLQT